MVEVKCATAELKMMKRGDLICEAKRLGVKLRKYGESGMTNTWLREQIAAKHLAPCPAANVISADKPRPASMVVKPPMLNAPPPRVSDDPDLPLLEVANQVLTQMEIQPPLSEYIIEEQLDESGKSLTLELSCRVGGVSAHVNADETPKRLVGRIEGLTREDFAPAKLRGLRGRINVENRALRLQLAQVLGHAGSGGESIPLKPDLINDPAKNPLRR